MLTRTIQDGAMHFSSDGTQFLTIQEKSLDGAMLLTLQGELRSETADHLQDELDAFTSLGLKVTLDFGGVTFICPSVMFGLLNAQNLTEHACRGEILLKNLPEPIYREIDRSNLAEFLLIE